MTVASPFALGLVLHRAHERAAGALVRALRPLGLELRHFAVLIALNACGPTKQSALADAADMDKATMVRVVDELARAGIVTRCAFPGDRRVHTIALTEHGMAVFAAAHANAEVIAERLVEHLPPVEASRLLELLAHFIQP